VNLDALVKLEEEGLPVYPSPKTLKLIQNKGIQKDFYAQHSIPTAPYQRFENLQALKSAINNKQSATPLFLNRVLLSFFFEFKPRIPPAPLHRRLFILPRLIYPISQVLEHLVYIRPVLCRY
jgi:hypothetical protein